MVFNLIFKFMLILYITKLVHYILHALKYVYLIKKKKNSKNVDLI